MATERRQVPSAAGWPPVRELQQRCARLAAEAPAFRYGGCLFTLLSVHANDSPRGTVIRPHRHSHYEAILILDGEARESSRPRDSLRAGSLQLHGPGDVHAWSAPRKALLRLGVWFTVEPVVSTRTPARWPRDPSACREARKLLADTMSNTPGRAQRLAARLTLLLAPALAMLDLPDRPSLALPATKEEGRGVGPFVQQFLADNLAEPLALDDVAAQFNMSVPTLTRRFRLETGESVMARLQDLRLGRSADLLRAGVLSVKEVGAAVGMPESSYFCRCFRRAFGDSPRRFGASAS